MGISWIKRSELTTDKMNFFILTAAVIAGVCADADPQLLLGGAALPYAVGSAVVATPPNSPASTVKTAPVIAHAALPAVGYAGLGYGGLGLGYAGLGYAGLGHAGLGYAGLGHAGLGYGGLGVYGRKKREADAGLVSALPVATLPAAATAGYAVGASGAIGGQGPVAAIAAPAALPAAVGYAGLGGPGLGYAGLGYAGLPYAG